MTTATITHPMRRGGLLARLVAAVRTRGRRLAGSRPAPSRSTSPTTTSSSRTRGRRPPTTSPADSSRSRSSSLAGVFYDRMRAGARATVALARRLPRRPRRHRGRLLHARGRAVRRRLLRAAVDPRRARAGRARRRHPLALAQDDRPPLVAVHAAGAARGRPRYVVATVVLLTALVSPTSSRTRLRAEVPAADLGAPYEDVAFTTSDGLRLEGWYIRVAERRRRDRLPGPRRLAEAREDAGRPRLRRPALRPPRRGRERGRPQHPRLARRARHPRRRALPPEPARRRSGRIGGIGLSVGGEMMIEAAAESPRSRRSCPRAAAAVPSATTSRTATRPGHRRRTRLLHGRGRALASDLPPTPSRASSRRARGTGVLRLRREGPAGRRSRPTRASTRSPAAPKEIWEVPDRGHMNGIEAQPAEYERRIVAFFDRTLEPSEGR